MATSSKRAYATGCVTHVIKKSQHEIKGKEKEGKYCLVYSLNVPDMGC